MRASRGGGPNLFGIDLRKLAARLVINVVAIIAAAYLVPGISLDNWKGAVLAGAIFGVVNSFIKPVVRKLTCPLYLLTLGLFSLVVNAAMLGITAWISGQIDGGFKVDHPIAAVLGGIVVGVVSWLVSLAL